MNSLFCIFFDWYRIWGFFCFFFILFWKKLYFRWIGSRSMLSMLSLLLLWVFRCRFKPTLVLDMCWELFETVMAILLIRLALVIARCRHHWAEWLLLGLVVHWYFSFLWLWLLITWFVQLVMTSVITYNFNFFYILLLFYLWLTILKWPFWFSSFTLFYSVLTSRSTILIILM